MKILTVLASVFLITASANATGQCSDLLNYHATKLRSSETLDFCQLFQGKVVVVVNTASNCGYTSRAFFGSDIRGYSLIEFLIFGFLSLLFVLGLP